MTPPTPEERAERIRRLSPRPLDEAWQAPIAAEIRAAQAEGLEEAASMAESAATISQYDDYKALYNSLARLFRQRAAALRGVSDGR